MSSSCRRPLSMNSWFALSQGPPVQARRIVVGERFVTMSAYVSTVAPSPGFPDFARSSVPEESLTSIVTTWSDATVSLTCADPIGPAGEAVGFAVGRAVAAGVAAGVVEDVATGVGAAVGATVGTLLDATGDA